MEVLVPYLTYLVLGLTGLSAVAMLIFGLRSMAWGKISMVSAALVIAVLVVFVVLSFVMGTWATAGIWTVLILLLVSGLALLLSSFKGLVT